MMYIATHKDFVFPKEIINNPDTFSIVKIAEDKEFNYKSLPENFPNIYDDLNGRNLRELNPYINEITALYYVYKNLSETMTDNWYGLCHYRRYFCESGCDKILLKNDFDNIFKDYDCITNGFENFNDVILQPNYKWNLFRSVRNHVEEQSYYQFYACFGAIYDAMLYACPQYIDYFIKSMNSTTMFYCEMIAMKKEYMDKFCKWLFSFLVNATKKIVNSDMKLDNQRLMGFFTERILITWILKEINDNPNFKVKALDVKFIS